MRPGSRHEPALTRAFISFPSIAATSSTTSWAVGGSTAHIAMYQATRIFNFYVPKLLIKIVVKVVRTIVFQCTVLRLMEFEVT